jgi:hypothetical protein
LQINLTKIEICYFYRDWQNRPSASCPMNQSPPPSGRASAPPAKSAAGLDQEARGVFRPARLWLQRRADCDEYEEELVRGAPRDRPGVGQAPTRRAQGLRPSSGRAADEGAALRRYFAGAGRSEGDRAVRAVLRELNLYHGLDVGASRLTLPVEVAKIAPTTPPLALTHSPGVSVAGLFEDAKSCATSKPGACSAP